MNIENMLNYLYLLKSTVTLEQTATLDEQLNSLVDLENSKIITNQKILNNFHSNSIKRKLTFMKNSIPYLIFYSEYHQNPNYKKFYGLSLDHTLNIKYGEPVIILFTEQEQESFIDYVVEEELYQYITENLDSDYLNESIYAEMENPSIDYNTASGEVLVKEDKELEKQIKDAYNGLNEPKKVSFDFVEDNLVYINEIKQEIKDKEPDEPISWLDTLQEDTDVSAIESKDNYNFNVCIQSIVNYFRENSTESYIPKVIYKEEINEIFAELPCKFTDFYNILLDLGLNNKEKVTTLGFITQKGLIFELNSDLDLYLGFPIVDMKNLQSFKISANTKNDLKKYNIYTKEENIDNIIISIEDVLLAL